jgi:hypothetical protein
MRKKINYINKISISLLIIFVINIIVTIPSFAISPSTLKSIYTETTFYDPNICTPGSGEEGDIGEGSDDGKVYQSGLTGPYILEQFMIHLLKRLSQKYNKPESDFVTKEHVVALVAFAIGEGGDINNGSIYNPLNLSLKAPDLPTKPWANNGAGGEQAYSSFDVGVEANARSMSKGYQDRLGYILSKPNSTAAQVMYTLTYYKKYEGNLAWATASMANPAQYYKERLSLVKLVRNDYANTAGVIIGTSAHEWGPPRKTKTDLITYKELIKSGNKPSNSTSDEDDLLADNECIDGSYSGGNSSVVSIAKAEHKKNVREWDKNVLKYTGGGQYAWCAAFASWVYKEAGYPLTKGKSHWRHTTVTSLIAYFKKYETYIDFGKQDPQPGDMVYYGKIPNASVTSSTEMAHVAIVIAYDKSTNTLITIGGNESDSVDKKNILIKENGFAQGMGYYITGWGRIK